jgi:hypothetical protein
MFKDKDGNLHISPPREAKDDEGVVIVSTDYDLECEPGKLTKQDGKKLAPGDYIFKDGLYCFRHRYEADASIVETLNGRFSNRYGKN